MTFNDWWMMLSKVPYMDKEEIANKAWYESGRVWAAECEKLRHENSELRAALGSLLADGKPEYCDHADECFQDDQAGWLAYDDPESSACGGCWFSLCLCASEAQTTAAELLMKGGDRE